VQVQVPLELVARVAVHVLNTHRWKTMYDNAIGQVCKIKVEAIFFVTALLSRNSIAARTKESITRKQACVATPPFVERLVAFAIINIFVFNHFRIGWANLTLVAQSVSTNCHHGSE
jgi:hypothetical protein